jgi:hypothetical protein
MRDSRLSASSRCRCFKISSEGAAAVIGSCSMISCKDWLTIDREHVPKGDVPRAVAGLEKF